MLQSRVSAGVWLACLVCASTAVRALAALRYATPGYFPDEYIYSAISRSIASDGRPFVRDEPAHFPALLEPLLAAPLWAIGSVETAYRLVQVENALFMSLAAVPVYLLARRLELTSGYALVCAAFTLLVPDLAFSSFVIADPVAYPLVLTAIYAGVRALQSPSARWQLVFLVTAGAATFARVQFVVLLPAFVVAAFALDRKAALRLHRLPLAIFGAGSLAVGAFGASRILGYYHAVGDLRVGGGVVRWAVLDLVLLSLASGVVLVPGALVGLVTSRERRDRAFAALVVPFSLAVMLEAALYAGNGSDRFKERYLFVLLPLLPLAFGVYQRDRRPARLAVGLIAAGIAVSAIALPLSGYAKGVGFDDSPLLWCYLELQWLVGSSGASVLVPACAVGGAALAVAATWPRLVRPALAGALALALAMSIGASRFANQVAHQIREQSVASNPSWVDAAHVGTVSAIQTDLAPANDLTEQLFWNRSIQHELLLGSHPGATDPLATDGLGIASNGDLFVLPSAKDPSGPREPIPLRNAFLFHGFAVSARFAGATQVASYSSYTLWRPAGTPRLVAYELGRYWDGWLGRRGGLQVWPAGARSGTVSFTLSLPRSRPAPVTVRFGNRSYRLTPGDHLAVRLPIHGDKPWSTTFSTTAGSGRLPDNRVVSVRSTVPRFTPS
jgi:Dolichyl-phosphate-mannose-protein mannosyltransferase